MAKDINIGGRLHSTATGNVVAGADEILDDVKGKKQSVINAETDAAIQAETERAITAENNRYTKAETYSKQEVNSLITTPNQEYVTVEDYASLPESGEADTIYRVANWDGSLATPAADITKYSEYAWDGTGYVFLSVKSQIGEVFDISEYHSGATYADLAAALGTNGANVPVGVRKGGMSVKFKQIVTPASYTVVKTEGLDSQPTGTEIVSDPDIDSGTYNASQLSAFSTLPESTGAGNAVTYWMEVAGDTTTYTSWVITMAHSSDNKYVQYRCVSDEFTTDVTQWQGIDDEPTTGSDNLVKSGGVAKKLNDLKYDINNNKAAINGGLIKTKVIENSSFVTANVQTEVLLPINSPIYKGAIYIVTVKGNVSIPENKKFNVSIRQGTTDVTEINTELIGKDLSGGQNVQLVTLDNVINTVSNLRILYNGLPSGVTININIEIIKDVTSLKQYGTDYLLDFLNFTEHYVIETDKEIINIHPKYSSECEGCAVECKEGNVFIINGTGYSKARLWAFVDNNLNVLSRADSNVTAENLQITAPTNSAYLIVNKHIDSNICYTKQVSRLINNITSNITSSISGLKDLSSITKYAFWISENTAPYTWSNSISRRSVIIPVQPGNILLIEPKEGNGAAYMFLSNFAEPITAGDTVYNVGDKVIINKTTCINVPDTANYVYITLINSFNQTLIESVFVRDDEVLTGALDNTKGYIDEKDAQIINDLPKYIQQTPVNVQNLNKLSYGFQDIIGSWWFYPEMVSVNTYRNKVFFGFIDKEGYSGVAELTCDSKAPMVIKNRLKHEYPDTHNSVSVTVLDDGRLLAVFPDGHNTGLGINIRVSKNIYSVDEFEAPIRVTSDASVAYSQVHKINGKYYIFFRSGITYWRYIVSEDLVNWSNPIIFLHDSGSMQRYFLAKPISDEPNKLRFITYSNPTYDDTNIRAGYIDFETNEVYDSTGVKVGDFGGDTPIETNDLTILVQQPTAPNKNRMFDLAVTPMDIIRFVYSSFDNSSSIGNDSIYFMYDNGTIRQICAGGQAYWIPKAQGGVQFLSATKVVVARSDASSDGYDYIEIYDLDNGSINLTKEIYKELKRGKYKNRNSYVLADCNGKYVFWFRGYYRSYGSSETYMRYDYDTDVMIYDVENDIIFK